MSVGPNLHMGQENPRITEVFPTGLSMDQVYKVVVTTNSFGQSVQEEKVFSECLPLFSVAVYFTESVW